MCKYCESDNNDFVCLNDTAGYSGIEIEMNRQGMLRVRYYGDKNILFESQDMINIEFCTKCGKKFKENR